MRLVEQITAGSAAHIAGSTPRGRNITKRRARTQDARLSSVQDDVSGCAVGVPEDAVVAVRVGAEAAHEPGALEYDLERGVGHRQLALEDRVLLPVGRAAGRVLATRELPRGDVGQQHQQTPNQGEHRRGRVNYWARSALTHRPSLKRELASPCPATGRATKPSATSACWNPARASRCASAGFCSLVAYPAAVL